MISKCGFRRHEKQHFMLISELKWLTFCVTEFFNHWYNMNFAESVHLIVHKAITIQYTTILLCSVYTSFHNISVRSAQVITT